MKNAILFGFGNIGKELLKQIPKEKVSIKYIVRSNGVFDLDLNKVGELNEWKKFGENIDVVFITIPTIGDGKEALKYASYFLEENIPVITCEKASIAHNFDYLEKYRNIFKYTASVGGGTCMLREIKKFDPKEIKEIKGVVNGTLNYIGDNLKKGKGKVEIIKDVLDKGFAEPGFTEFETIIKSELNDVVLKTVIIANHSGIFENTMTRNDVELHDNFDLSKRCIIRIDRDKIEAGFLEDNNGLWLPEGVNNILYINGKEVCSGPGAGAKATVESMLGDLNSLV